MEKLVGCVCALLPCLRSDQCRIGDRSTRNLHFNGAFPGVVFGAGDEQLLGRSFAGLRHDNPKLDTLVVDSTTSMCAMMMSWEITILATQAGRVLTEQRHRGRLARRWAWDRHEAADEARQHSHTCTRKP